MATTDDIVEDKADKHRGHVVNGSRRRYGARAEERDREVDVLEEADFELLVQYPLEQWCKNAGKGEKDEAIVELTVRK